MYQKSASSAVESMHREKMTFVRGRRQTSSMMRLSYLRKRVIDMKKQEIKHGIIHTTNSKRDGFDGRSNKKSLYINVQNPCDRGGR